MAGAQALLMASVREGWGMVVTEANAVGTPAIVYNVPGLRDSVRHGITGLIVEPTSQALADAMYDLSVNEPLRRTMSVAAERWSRDFSYDRAAEMARMLLSRLVAA
jgi:glycosyltransferase involved in cell wall biosynthesis